MRLLLLVLMMVFLPLRGWSGELMATHMAVQQVAFSDQAYLEVQAQDHAHDHALDHAQGLIQGADAELADCHGHTQSPPGPEACHAGACDACGVCQACHSFALTMAVPESPAHWTGLHLPSADADRFTSADAAPGHKPPIA